MGIFDIISDTNLADAGNEKQSGLDMEFNALMQEYDELMKENDKLDNMPV